MTEHQNVDNAEIAKFEAIAERWWDQDGEFKPLHEINPLRLDFVANKTQGLFDKETLDVGCGGGILSESMARMGAHVTGIDMGQEPLTVAKLHSLETGVNVDYIKVPAEEFATQHPARFDVITCMEMLEHVPFPEKTIEACSSVVKKGGQLYFSTINRNPKSFMMAILGAEYFLKLLPKGTHEYDCFIKPSELEKWARKYNLHLDELIGVEYNPFSKSFSLTEDVSVNYMMKYTKV